LHEAAGDDEAARARLMATLARFYSHPSDH
jgi:hypothetical protein